MEGNCNNLKKKKKKLHIFMSFQHFIRNAAPVNDGEGVAHPEQTVSTSLG